MTDDKKPAKAHPNDRCKICDHFYESSIDYVQDFGWAGFCDLRMTDDIVPYQGSGEQRRGVIVCIDDWCPRFER